MATRYVGQTGIKQLQQPGGSELSFAAIIAAVASEHIHSAHEALVKSGISSAAGRSFVPRGQTELTIGNAMVTTKSYICSEAALLLEAIKYKHNANQTVALLQKENSDPADPHHHWSLVAGHYENEGQIMLFSLMDPHQAQRTYVDPAELSAQVDQTIAYNGGIYVTALYTTLSIH
jgi:hypothetical protein